MDINGKWVGYYQYGVGYDLPFFGERVEIQVVFSLDSEGNISGSMTETGPYSVPLKSSLKGFVDLELISFIKSYNASPRIKKDYSGIEINKGSLEIDHNGFIDNKNNAIYGEWIIEEQFVNHDGHNDVEFFTGIWILKKL